jgi:hypothetical protein
MLLNRDKKAFRQVRVYGSGCGHCYQMEGDGIVGDIFRGLLSAGKKLFKNLKVQQLARATGKSLLTAGKKFAKEELVPSVKKSAVKFAGAAAEEGVNRIVSQIEGSKRKQKDLGQLAQDISVEEMSKLKERVRKIAVEEGKRAKSMAISNLNNLGVIEQEYEKIADASMYQNGQGLVRLGAKAPTRRKRGRPRKRN